MAIFKENVAVFEAENYGISFSKTSTLKLCSVIS